jgi:hypothetical protein
LVIAVPRAEALVPAETNSGEMIYPLRFGDGARAAPEWLISDLRLGRRIRPQVQLHADRVGLSHHPGSPDFDCNISFKLENIGTTWIDRASVVVVFPVANAVQPSFIPRLLIESVEQARSEISGGVSFAKGNLDVAHQLLSPLMSGSARVDVRVPCHPEASDWNSQIPNMNVWPMLHKVQNQHDELVSKTTRRVMAKLAVALLIDGAAPQWYQFIMLYGSNCTVIFVELDFSYNRPVVKAEIVRTEPNG